MIKKSIKNQASTSSQPSPQFQNVFRSIKVKIVCGAIRAILTFKNDLSKGERSIVQAKVLRRALWFQQLESLQNLRICMKIIGTFLPSTEFEEFLTESIVHQECVH